MAFMRVKTSYGSKIRSGLDVGKVPEDWKATLYGWGREGREEKELTNVQQKITT